jgi:hypothetical protein
MNHDLGDIRQALLNAIAVGRIDCPVHQGLLPTLEVGIGSTAHSNEPLKSAQEKALEHCVMHGIDPIASSGLTAYREGPVWRRTHRAHLSIPENRTERMPPE